MAQITTEQALQIPQQLKRQGSHSDSQPSPRSPSEPANNKPGALSDDSVTLRLNQPEQLLKKLKVDKFKQELGSENAFIKETIRANLNRLGLNPNTSISVSKNDFGALELQGSLLQNDLEKLKDSLQQNAAFMGTFNKVSQQQPTLDYVDNVVKIANAYGVSNNLFNSIVSENEQFNGLNDIAHRYQMLRSNTPLDAETATTAQAEPG